MHKPIHEFDGACRPKGRVAFGSQETFSVGVFEILPKASGKGTKRGPVKVRIKGRMGNPEPVYKKAREIVDLLDAGEYSGPKIVRVQ